MSKLCTPSLQQALMDPSSCLLPAHQLCFTPETCMHDASLIRKRVSHLAAALYITTLIGILAKLSQLRLCWSVFWDVAIDKIQKIWVCREVCCYTLLYKLQIFGGEDYRWLSQTLCKHTGCFYLTGAACKGTHSSVPETRKTYTYAQPDSPKRSSQKTLTLRTPGTVGNLLVVTSWP